jgi:hypothetical protein
MDVPSSQYNAFIFVSNKYLAITEDNQSTPGRLVYNYILIVRLYFKSTTTVEAK